MINMMYMEHTGTQESTGIRNGNGTGRPHPNPVPFIKNNFILVRFKKLNGTTCPALFSFLLLLLLLLF